MPIISTIGRRQPKTRLIIWIIYLLLTAGALTMVYPFLLMVSGSTKSAVDTPDGRVIPAYLLDDTALYRKHIEGLFNESTLAMQNAYGLEDATFRRIEPPKPSPLLEDWTEFLRSAEEPSHFYLLGYVQCPLSRGSTPFNLGKLRKQLLREEGSIQALNLKYDTSFASPSAFGIIPPNFTNRFMDFPDTAFLCRVEKFCADQPETWRCYVSISNLYRDFLRSSYGKSIAAYNTAKGTNFASWDEIPTGTAAADFGPWAAADFEQFVRELLNPVWIRIDPSAISFYRQYLAEKYDNNIALFNNQRCASYSSFSEIPLPETLPRAGVEKSDWKGFVEGWQNPLTHGHIAAPLSSIRITGPDFAFRDHLAKKYGAVETMNAALKTNFLSWSVVEAPQQQAHYRDFLEMRGWLRGMFTTRNYVDVWNYLVINGRGLLNTLIFCALAILAALTVDPIAAYALSRFKPRSTYKVLLFLMMTMAFPAMVTQIPAFLLLRDLGLLNTFWALVLPGLANGYHIFLLKGFFDSLPRELYESAEIDGASEVTIFFNITMALSKPILAVIALGAFTSTYAAFMFALLLCQDPKMWTLMVWLYQLQQHSAQGIIFASLIIAAIPTFVVFIFCQKIIMRGIVVPVEK